MCISPTAIVVLPTPELVPATTMVGILVAGCVVRARMTVELTSDAMRIVVIPRPQTSPTRRLAPSHVPSLLHSGALLLLLLLLLV